MGCSATERRCCSSPGLRPPLGPLPSEIPSSGGAHGLCSSPDGPGCPVSSAMSPLLGSPRPPMLFAAGDGPHTMIRLPTDRRLFVVRPHRFIAGLPKAELHVHHVGSASPRIVAELAARHPDSKVPTDPEALADYFTFTDFAHFIEVYLSVVDLIRTPEDVRLLTYEVARDMARQQIRYAELTVTPFSSTRRGIDERGLHGRRSRTPARRPRPSSGVVLRWCFDIPGEAGLRRRRGDRPARHRTCGPEGLVSFGLGGPEIGVPRPQFKPYFDRAIAAGLHSRAARRGDHRPADRLGRAERRCAPSASATAPAPTRDPRLLAHLAEHRIPLEVCPTSNIATRAVADLDEHPIKEMVAGRRPGHDQQRRPADVRHRPEQRVRGRRPAAEPRRARASPISRRTPLRPPSWTRRARPGSTRRSTPTSPGGARRAELPGGEGGRGRSLQAPGPCCLPLRARSGGGAARQDW